MARPTQKIPRYIDSNFLIPEGLTDARYFPVPEITDEETDNLEEDIVEEDEFVVNEDEPDDQPDVPEQFTVVSQTPRIAPDGSRVVDIVIEVEDILGITKYDVRKTKIS